MHPNPNVEGALKSRLAGNDHIEIIAPQEYLGLCEAYYRFAIWC